MASTRGRGRGGNSTPEYLGGSSEKRYQAETRERIRQQVWRRWSIRLVVLGLLGFAYWQWGDDVRYYLTKEGKSTASTFQRAGQSLQSGAEERGGANLNLNE